MFYIYTPYVTPSGKRLANSKIIIYEAIPNSSTRNQLATTIRKFELTRKGWKISNASGSILPDTAISIETVSTVPLNYCSLLCFDSFDNAYTAKCILINRIPEVYLNMISVLTTKMNSLKSVTPELQYMADAVPELFI